MGSIFVYGNSVFICCDSGLSVLHEFSSCSFCPKSISTAFFLSHESSISLRLTKAVLQILLNVAFSDNGQMSSWSSLRV